MKEPENYKQALREHLTRTTWLDYEDAGTLIMPILRGVADIVDATGDHEFAYAADWLRSLVSEGGA